MNGLSCQSTPVRIVAAAAVMLLLTGTMLGQQAPALEKGFSADKLYQFGDLDSINTFNGNLTFRIPIGPSYPVNAGMSYALTLTYNSKVWDYEEIAGTSILAVPTRRSNAGLGWLLSLGRIINRANSVNTALEDVYESSDSADHVFFGALHDTDNAVAPTLPVTDVKYTRDGTYIRRLYKNTGTTDLEFPDGTIKTFDSASGDLKSVRDRFGNGFDVTTLTSPTDTPCSLTDFAAAWKITDTSSARTNYVCFANTFQYPDATYPGLIERVVLASPPDASNASQQAVYRFAYTNPTVCRGPGTTFLNAQRDIQIPRLASVSQPDGSAFLFRYPPPNPGDTCGAGELTSVDLPTGGTIDYTYRGYSIPVDRCNASPTWNSEVTGIASRTMSGPRIPTTQWSYNSALSTTDALVACENNQGINVFRRAPAEQMIVTVTDPFANVEEHYYSVWPVPFIDLIYDLSGQIIHEANGDPIQHSPNGFQLSEYGLPLTHLTSSDGRLLSRRIYTSSGYAASPPAPLRSFYQSRENDSVVCTAQDFICGNNNSRVNHDRTVYHDDGSAITDVDSSDFDGLGHYRTTALAGSFATGNATIVTSFNKRDPDVNPSGGINSGQYPGSFTLPTPGDAWLLNIPGSTKRTEGGVTATTETCFSSVTGFARAHRVLKGSTRSATDLLSVYAPEQPFSSPTGNVSSELFFGGDVKHNAPTGTDLCALADSPPTDFEYKISHTYVDGVRTTSQYAGTPFLALDRTIDPATGFVTSSRDTAGQETKYAYDSAFRLLSITPPGRVATTLTYSVASGSGSSFTPARVEMRSASQTSNTTSGAATSGTVEKHYSYDALGRLWREKTRMPDATWSVRDVLFNAMGLKASISEQEQLSPAPGTQELDFVPSHTTIYSNYDPFGRPGSMTLPDTHVMSFRYFGIGSMVRTSKIATSAGSESDTSVTETYDRQGRLYRLTENSAPDGSAVETTYGYHVTGGLSSVSMNSNGTPQNRTFAYDGRGLLLHEEHPEKDGPVIYGTSETDPSYDSRGHATRLIDGPVDLTYTYDAAERLLTVSEIDPTSQSTPPARRTLKSFTYGQNNDLQKGKLLTATRMNHLTDGRTVAATETYTYDSGSAISKRDTAVTIDGVPFQTFSESFGYDDLGELSKLTYPTCLTTCGSASGAVGISERHYTNGALTSITGYAAIGYNANATVGSVAHGNGVTDTIAPDDSAMPRPKSITYSGFNGCPVPSLPVITPAQTSLCAGQSGSVSVPGQQGATFTWSIEGGNITSNTGLSVTYTATSTTSVLLHVGAANSCGSSAVSTASVSVTGTAIQQQPQNTTIASGSTAALHVTATGTALTYQWYRGLSGDQSNSVAGATAADFTTPPVTATTTYWVKVVGQCGTVNSVSATVTVNLPAPTNLRATTQQATPQGGSNTVVTLRWNSVPGASAYLVEWSTSVNGSFAPINPSNPTTVQITATHVVAATTLPAAYVYHVRSVDSGGTASPNASNLDYAVTGARLFANVNAQDEPLRKGLSPVRAMDIVELRRCIDALRGAAGLSQVWAGAAAPSGLVTANDFLSLQPPLNLAMQAFGYGPFAYSGVLPPASCVTSPCVPILSEHVQQLRDTLRNALR